MDRYLSHHRPVVDRHTGNVVAWIVRVTLRGDSPEAFDDIRFAVREPTPVNSWRRNVVDVLVTHALRGIDENGIDQNRLNSGRYPAHLVQYARLIGEFNHRARFETLERFQFSEET